MSGHGGAGAGTGNESGDAGADPLDPFSQTASLPYLPLAVPAIDPRYRPAAYCAAADGSIEIFAALGDGTVWWQRYRYDPKTDSMILSGLTRGIHYFDNIRLEPTPPPEP
jgi:hypothetical protein